ncbi:MAG TPA: twin-arginine translocase TatA/TatE family subunit [Candidatus Dormibacteraeota bacterium]|jgi:sec-independent protein translocase protein TatA
MQFHPFYLVVILVVVLIIFGPGRLPELGGAVGRAMREFRKATNDLTSEVTNATQPQPTPAPQPPTVTSATESTAKGSTSEADQPKS